MPHPFRIFVAKLPQTVTKEELSEHFSQFGKIVDVYIPFNPTTQQTKGMAFISFDNPDSVEVALNHGEHMLGGQALEAKRAEPKPEQKMGRNSEPTRGPGFDYGHDDQYGYGPPRGMMPPFPGGPGMGDFGGGPSRAPRFRVFVREIPDAVTEEALRQYFDKFGVVSDVYIPMSQTPDGPRRRGIAYITFKTEQQLERCLATPKHELQGVELPCGRADDRIERKRDEGRGGRFRGPDFPGPSFAGPPPAFRMAYGAEPAPRHGRSDPPGNRGEILVSPKRIFVGGIPQDMGSRQIAEHFKQYGGEITDVYFPKDAKTGNHRGFCYITFAEDIAVHRAVANAPREIDGAPIGEVKVAEARKSNRESGPPPPMHGGYGGEMDDFGMYGGRHGGGGMGFGAGDMRMPMGGGGPPPFERNLGGGGPPPFERNSYGGGGYMGDRDGYGGVQTSYLNRYGSTEPESMQPHMNEAVRAVAGLDDLVQALSGKINPLLHALSGSSGAGIGGQQAQSPYGGGAYGGGGGGYGSTGGGYGGAPAANGGYSAGASGGYSPAPIGGGGYGGSMRGHDSYGADSRYRPY